MWNIPRVLSQRERGITKNKIKINISNYLHRTVKSTSVFRGVCDIILLASHLNLALLSLASAVNV